MGGFGQFFPKSVAQLTGVIVAGIVGFGTDSDLFVAIPLGVFAGALSTLFVTMADGKPKPPAPQDWQTYRQNAPQKPRPRV
jgi:hypothetical protein